MITEEQRDFLLPEAYNAAVRAGAVILDIYNGESDYNVEQKPDCTPITIADRMAHDVIKSSLMQTRIPLLSEEGREMLYEERRGWDLFWMVDPLDGTKEFIKGNGEFTVNIALMQDNAPVLAVIYVPYIKKLYFADRHTGAFLKEKVEADPETESDMEGIVKDAMRLPLRDRANDPIRIALSRSHKTPQTLKHIEWISYLYPGATKVEQGSSYKFCLLAEGSVDYYARMTHTYEWDTAAGGLILELAGGSIRSLEGGRNLTYNKNSLVNPHFACCSKYMPYPEQ